MKKFVLLFLLLSIQVLPQGKIYFVFGSDTAIWDGMGGPRVNVSLFVDPSMNGYKVMDPAFRNTMKDKFGTPLKMTWWMMAGNMFGVAQNTNVPVPNIMTLHLMNKYYGTNAALIGDEITMHYHTFRFYDYDGDGVSRWNQTMTFNECREDFDLTLAQFLLEEKTFPVSFRSGWHYMDNEWQMYLNKLLPYSLHNDYPAVRKDTIEPIDNIFDWSKASSEFVPFQPLDTNYQLGGGTGGWNVRSIYMKKPMSGTLMNDIFNKAKNGKTQIVCLWSHLPEEDFLKQIKDLDSLIHKTAISYPSVDYRYTTGIEAYQRYFRSQDTTKPQLVITEVPQGENISYKITSNEKIFQEVPFTAIKTTFNNYKILSMTQTGVNEWTTESVKKKIIAKISSAVTDTIGNQSIETLSYLPDDIHIDNSSSSVIEESGVWTTINNVDNWESTSRSTTSDTASLKITITVPKSGYYSLSFISPVTFKIDSTYKTYLYSNNIITDTISLPDTLVKQKWSTLKIVYLDKDKSNYFRISKNGSGTLAFDVFKLSALVPDYYLYAPEVIQTGSFIEKDTTHFYLNVENKGINNFVINNVQSSNALFTYVASLPTTIQPGKKAALDFIFYKEDPGEITDTIFISGSDNTTLKVILTGDVKKYYRVVDNDDSLNYSETGTWSKSVAQAYGTSSRYSSTVGSTASFKMKLRESGYYQIGMIVPVTVNAVIANYKLKINNRVIETRVVDQNQGSGKWMPLFEQMLPADSLIEVLVSHNSNNNSGNVLRADAVIYQKLGDAVSVNGDNKLIVTEYKIEQNFPNPFNPTTLIRYSVPEVSKVQLEIYNINGERISSSYLGEKSMGTYDYQLNLSSYASGVYVYMFKFVDANGKMKMFNKKMMLLK